jgi:hypothetical protein
MNKLERPDWGKLFAEALTSPGKLSEAYSVFHEYSLSNRILATIQLGMRGLPLAPIASFNKWKEQGRHVKKGEKAISLIMLLSMKSKAKGLMGEGDEADGGENKAGKRGFTIFVLKRNWFSLDQTDGAAYQPEVTIPEWDKAQALANLEITEECFAHLNGNVHGYAFPNEKRLAVNPLAAMPWKTLFHEIAHCLLHSQEAQMADGALMPKDIKEAEAESVAYLCCATLGLPGLEDSRGYIQDWLGSSERSEEFARKRVTRVFSTADKILKAGSKASKEGEDSHE